MRVIGFIFIAGWSIIACAQNTTPALPRVVTTVEVKAENNLQLEAVQPTAVIAQKEMQQAAGTFGDFTRYLQVMPGVVKSSDMSNELLVRGGHPTENLFVVDGVEVPNLNHFALPGSNGGFTSMLDTALIGSVEMRDDAWDAAYSSRLSSLVEIHTRELGAGERAGEASFGIAGAGGFYQRAIGKNTSVLFSAHKSMISLMTNDIGINGVPTYMNGLIKYEYAPTAKDHFMALAVGGDDSIAITPCPSDARATSIIQTQYEGWRSTEALTWDHMYSPRTNSKLTFTQSTMSELIGQQQQNGYLNTANNQKTCNPQSLTNVYNQNSRDGMSAINYTVRTERNGWLISYGASEQLTTPRDAVAQPVGQLSPFSASTSESDAVNFNEKFLTSQSAGFAELEGGFGSRWKLMAGLRGEYFGIDHMAALDPRASLAYKLNNRQMLHFAASINSQLPPMMDMISYSANRYLKPVTVMQTSFGLRAWQGNWGTLDVNVYQKNYRNEAVSTEYKQLMLANMIDTLGQQFVWLPLASSGSVQSRGIELALRAHVGSRIQIMTTATYSHTMTRALDGIRRPGNFDVPLTVNAMASLRLPAKLDLNTRETFTSGRVYTPFDLAASDAQSRGIYDLTQVNGARGPLYNRLDVELERRMKMGRGEMDLQLGAENVLNRGNLMGYTWLQNCQLGAYCANGQQPVVKVDQMGRFPEASVRYRF
jgi:outer membrane receptor protein involved in Fe transport